MKRVFAFAVLALVMFSSGCVTFEEEPQVQCEGKEKLVDGVCCFDDDDNGVCDIEERECPDSCDDGDPCTSDHCSQATNFECRHDEITPCCGNGECEESEEIANECPEDCVVIDMTDFEHRFDGPDYMDGDRFVFIKAEVNETEDFHLNITADDTEIRKIGVTYNCTDSQTGLRINSIDADKVEVVEGYTEMGYQNEFQSDDYTIYSSFYSHDSKDHMVEVNSVEPGDSVEFRISMIKEEHKVVSDLDCEFNFYFLQPSKQVKKHLRISYI